MKQQHELLQLVIAACVCVCVIQLGYPSSLRLSFFLFDQSWLKSGLNFEKIYDNKQET